MEQLGQDWEVRSLDDLDSEGLQLLSDFFNEQFPGVFYPKCTPDIFRWKLGECNPAGRGFLTLAMCNGLVVGAASGTRKILRIKGETLDAIEIGDTFTHPDFRRKGKCITPLTHNQTEDPYFTLSVFGRLVSETINRAKLNGISFIYGTPNENSKPPYLKRLGFYQIDYGKISSNIIITSKLKSMRKVRWLLIFFESVTFVNSNVLRYLILGKNSISEITKKDFLEFCKNNMPTANMEQRKIFLVRSAEILEHRYVRHPNYNYRFFQVTIKGVVKGVFITTQIHRSSGVNSLVVSDWIFKEEKVEKRVALFISSLKSYYKDSEVISFWEFKGLSKPMKFFLGIFTRKRVSLIARDYRDSHSSPSTEFGNFCIGWSDNG